MTLVGRLGAMEVKEGKNGRQYLKYAIATTDRRPLAREGGESLFPFPKPKSRSSRRLAGPVEIRARSPSRGLPLDTWRFHAARMWCAVRLGN